MNRNWFRNEAIFMMFPVFLFLIAGLYFFIYPIYKNHLDPIVYSEEKVQPDFNIGIKVGYITAMQEDIFVAFTDLNHFRNNHDIKMIEEKRHFINTSLISLYKLNKEIPKTLFWPENIRDKILFNNFTYKEVFEDIRKQRIEGQWTWNDEIQEEEINQILDLYIAYGNPYKLK